MITVATIVDYLEQFAPLELAESWDNVGLLLGDRNTPVQGVMTCLTVTPESVAEALALSAQLIVTHHPILFRAVKRLTTATPEGRMLLALAKAGVAVHSPHTAFDNTQGGINDLLSRRLGLTDVVPLRRGESETKCKIVAFVPASDLGRVSDAMFDAGAGNIGQYSQCSFRLAGTGTFFGSESSNPIIGQKGKREEVDEWRLEAICPAHRVEAVVAAMRRAHSYEEPAYDVYPLRTVLGSAGVGRLGSLAQAESLENLARTVKTVLGASQVQTVGEHSRKVERLALVCGAGGELLTDAVRAGADAFLTGELRFHDYLAAEAQGLALILPGHYATERPGVEELAERLRQQWPELNVWASRQEHDPATWV